MSSFGLSGTNAHVVLTEAPPAPPITTTYAERPLHLLALSARSLGALRELARRYADLLSTTKGLSIADVCFTANTGRALHRERLTVVAADIESLADRLGAFAAGEEARNLEYAQVALEHASVAFVVGGSPRVLANTVRALRSHAAMASVVGECDRLLTASSAPTVSELLFGSAPIPAEVAPLAAFVSEVAVARLWNAWGVSPAAVIGLGTGMLTAAHLAGALPLERALRLAWRYGEWRALRDAAAPERELASAWAALQNAATIADVAPPQLPIISGRTGQTFDVRAATAAEWSSLGPDIGSWDTARAAVETLGCRCVLELSSDEGAEPWPRLLGQMARLHLAGARVDWAAYDAGYDRRVVSLPTYPFDRQRYWITPSGDPVGLAPRAPAVEATHEVAAASAHDAEPVEDACIHEVAWRRRRVVATAPSAKPGAWLLIGDDGGIGESLRAQMEIAGHRATLISEIVALSNVAGVENASSDALAVAFARAGHSVADPLQGLVYFAKSGDDAQVSTPSALCVAQERGALAALRLVQALEKTRAMPRRLCLVTRGSQSVRDDDPPAPALMPFWAMGATIANEYPHVRVTRADLPNTPDDDTASMLAAYVLGDDPEIQIAFRDGARYVPRLVRQAPTTDRSSRPVSFPLDANATYLVTGGLGALGLATARWLGERGARQLVLLSRGREFPREMHSLLEQGISVTVHAADVADADAMHGLFDELRRTHPPLRGIIHAAGVLEDGLLRQQTAERFARVLRPKVGGAWVLHECSRDLALDFFVCFSSMAGIIGTPGQGNYVAANAGMDALARYRRSLGLPATSVRWGPWAGGGMALAIGAHDPNRLQSIGVRPLSPAFALGILEGILRDGGGRGDSGRRGRELGDVCVESKRRDAARVPFGARVSAGVGSIGVGRVAHGVARRRQRDA